MNNVIKIKGELRDQSPSTYLYYSCFQCLVDFVEKDKGLYYLNEQQFDKEIEVVKELYDWWLKVRYNSTFSHESHKDKLKQLINIYDFLWV